MTAERAVMLIIKVTYFGEFGYLNSSCFRKSIILMSLSSSIDKFTLLLQNSLTDVSVGFCRHFGAHLDGYQHGVSIQVTQFVHPWNCYIQCCAKQLRSREFSAAKHSIYCNIVAYDMLQTFGHPVLRMAERVQHVMLFHVSKCYIETLPAFGRTFVKIRTALKLLFCCAILKRFEKLSTVDKYSINIIIISFSSVTPANSPQTFVT